MPERKLVEQRSVPAVYMRGGTSRALVFHRRDLPEGGPPHDSAAWDEIFCGVLGSPDPYGRQLDGMGGGISSLSKVAVISSPTRAGADIDYTFGQVDVTKKVVGYRGNCGNISSAVGPFAVDEGLVAVTGDRTSIVIHNTNTKKLIRASFDVLNGKAAVKGDFALDGVAGTGAPIELAFLEPGGAATGKLLPTGHVRDALAVPGFGTVDVSFVDAANPFVFLHADAVGLTGYETADELAGNAKALAIFEEIRIAAAVAMGLVREPEEARTKMRNLPFVAMVRAYDRAQSKSATPADVTTRMISSGLPHKATPLTGAMCLAIAASIRGTIVNDIAGAAASQARPIVVEHPSGVLPVAARVSYVNDEPLAHEVIVFRTARRLMEGRVYFAGA